MKTVVSLLRITLFFIIGYLLFSTGSLNLSQRSQNPSDLIMGRWEGTREYADASGPHEEKIRLVFLNSGILTYSSSITPQLQYGIVFRTAFVSQDRLILTGRIRDEWRIESTENTLSIQGGIWKNEIVSFSRIRNVGPVIVSILVILIFEFIFSWHPHNHKVKDQNLERVAIEATFPSGRLLGVVLLILTVLVAALTGKLLTDRLSNSELLLSQGLPWWPLIVIELFVWIATIGTKLVASSRYPSNQDFIFFKGNMFLGVFLGCASVYGIFVGCIRLFFLYILPLVLTSLI